MTKQTSCSKKIISTLSLGMMILFHLSSSEAAELCRSVLIKTISNESKQEALMSLARLKLQIDTSAVAGTSTSAERLFVRKYIEKKNELLHQLNLSESAFKTELELYIRELQKEQDQAKITEAIQRSLPLSKWQELRSFPREMVFTSDVSADYQLAFKISTSENTAIMQDLVTGKNTSLPNPRALEDFTIADHNETVLLDYGPSGWQRIDLKTRQIENFDIEPSKTIADLSEAQRALSDDHQKLLFHTMENSVFTYHLINTKTGKKINSGALKLPFVDVNDTTILSDGKILITGDFSAVLLDPKSKAKLVLNADLNSSAIVSADNRYLVTSSSGNLYRFDLQTGKKISRKIPATMDVTYLDGNEIWLWSRSSKEATFTDRVDLHTLEELPSSPFLGKLDRHNMHILSDREILIQDLPLELGYPNGIYDMTSMQRSHHPFNHRYASGVDLKRIHVSRDGKRIIIQSEVYDRGSAKSGDQMFDIWEKR